MGAFSLIVVINLLNRLEMGKGFKTTVKFDESSRLEFVQGMRKRKDQRRKKAQNQIKLKLKKERKAYDRRKRELRAAEVAHLDKIEVEAEEVNQVFAKEVTSNCESVSIPGVTIEPISFDTDHLSTSTKHTQETDCESEEQNDGQNTKSNKEQLDDLRVNYKKMVKDRLKKQKNKNRKGK